MGALVSRRVGSETYYTSYERSFERLDAECARIQIRNSRRKKALQAHENFNFKVLAVTAVAAALFLGWMHRQPVHTFSVKEQFSRSILAVAAPVLLAVVLRISTQYLRWRQQREEYRLKKLADLKRKLVKELKDSTRFEKTLALLKKYDPDAPPPQLPQQAIPTQASPGMRRRLSTSDGQRALGTLSPYSAGANNLTPGSMVLRPAAAAAGIAADAGRALMPMFDRLAQFVGDDPTLVEDVRRTRQEAQFLRSENEALKRQINELQCRLEAATRDSDQDQLQLLDTEHVEVETGQPLLLPAP